MATDKVVFTPTCKQPWHVDEEEALACLPDYGWLRDTVEYGIDNTDSPGWFHIAANLTTLATLAANANLRVTNEYGGDFWHGFQIWTLIVATSGQRKSTAMDYAIRIAELAREEVCLANSGSPEAYHDALSDPPLYGNALFYRDEMQGLFEAALRNSYSGGIASWLLDTYQGTSITRETKTHGKVKIDRPRVCILSAIPPDTFQRSTTHKEWRSGYLPRFSFWSARRERFMSLPSSSPSIEAKLGRRMKRILGDIEPDTVEVRGPEPIVRPLIEWVRDEVEAKVNERPEDLHAVLTRLQVKGLQYAGLIALSRLETSPTRTVTIGRNDIECAISILRLLKRSVEALYRVVSSDAESAEEGLVIAFLRGKAKGARMGEISDGCSLSRARTNRVLAALNNSGEVIEKTVKTSSRGRPSKYYILVDGT